MGFLDDIAGFLDDVRQVGEEFDGLKQEVLASVADLGEEAAGTVAELKDTLIVESTEE